MKVMDYMSKRNVTIIVGVIIIITVIILAGIVSVAYIENTTTTARVFNRLMTVKGEPEILAVSSTQEYCFIIKDETTITYEGKEIDVSELKEGDIILVHYKYSYTIIPGEAYDAVWIKLLENNQ